MLVDVTGRSAATELFGKPMAMPVAVAPTGSAGLVWYQGELELARAAADANIPFTLATNAMTSMEAVARDAGGRPWFQLNMFADRSIAHALVKRAEANGFEALVLTADCSVVPNREYNARNGFTVPFRLSRRSALDASGVFLSSSAIARPTRRLAERRAHFWICSSRNLLSFGCCEPIMVYK